MSVSEFLELCSCCELGCSSTGNMNFRATFILLASALVLQGSRAMPQQTPQGTKTCSVIQQDDKSIRPCVFPFSYRDEIYNDCTTVAVPDGRAWCSTKVDENGVHVGLGGFWGHCDDCQRTTTPQTTTTTTTTTTTDDPLLEEEKKRLIQEITEGIFL